MLAYSLISDVIPVVRTSDSGNSALSLMEVFKVSHLPIVNNVEFLGLISDNDIYDMDSADEPVGNHSLSLFRPFVYDDQHIYEVVDSISRQNLSLIPVLERDNTYLGAVVLQDLAKHFAHLTAADQPGGVILLEMHMHDYTLTEISQIIEGNDTKILSLYVSTHPNTMKVNVTIKVNRTDISAILQSFNRYGYTVVATYSEDELVENMNNTRYEEFMNYMNI